MDKRTGKKKRKPRVEPLEEETPGKKVPNKKPPKAGKVPQVPVSKKPQTPRTNNR